MFSDVMNRKSEKMFMVQNLFKSFFWKDVTNPTSPATNGMNEIRKTSHKSMMLGVICHMRPKKVNVTRKGTANVTKKTFLSPVRTANVLFSPFGSFSISGASRLRLRKNPYNIKGIERQTKRGES